MYGILAGALLVVVALVGGTMLFVVQQSSVGYHAAVDRCLNAGGAWRPRSAWSFSGTCLRNPPRTSP